MTHNETNQENVVKRASLPTAAQRWLDRALPQYVAHPSVIQIEQEGTMEVLCRWTPFTASCVYRVSPLSFDWQARFRVLPGAWIVAEDGHSAGQGWGRASLWGVIPMGERTDPEVLITQLVRNLVELAWLPSFVLAEPALVWSDVGETAFEIRFIADEREVMVRFEVDDQGDLIRVHSPARPYDVPGGYAEAPRHYKFSGHGEFGGVRLPAVAVATFEKAEGPQEYFRGQIRSITLGATQV